MAKKQIRLSESDLKSIIRESVVKFLNENIDKLSDREKDIARGYWSSVENMRMPKQKYPFDEKPKKSKWELDSVNEMDELSPDFAIHAAHAAAEDKKKYPGRGKNSSDPAKRAKRDAQIKKFGDYAADAINSDMNDPDSMVIGDRGARRMMVANGPHSAYLTNDLEDIDSAKVYDDNFKDGDEPMAIADLKEINPEFYAKIHKNFAKFKGYHDRAKELDDKYLEEAVNRVLRRTLTEANFGIDPAAKMLYVSRETDGGVIAFDPRTKRKAFVPAEEILSNNPEDIIRVSAGTFAKYFG